jgi:hypothetical protein
MPSQNQKRLYTIGDAGVVISKLECNPWVTKEAQCAWGVLRSYMVNNMFYGATIVRFFGALVRWLIKGFKGTFKDVWNGPSNEDGNLSADYEVSTNIIGFVFIVTLIIVLTRC